MVDPYIEVFVKGIHADEIRNIPRKSDIVRNNGFKPRFDWVVDFKFNCPELAFLVIRVMDKDVIRD